MWQKSESNSKQNASSNAPNVDKDNILLNVSHGNHSNCCDVRENLNGIHNSFFGTNMVSETNVDSNKRFMFEERITTGERWENYWLDRNKKYFASKWKTKPF